MLVLTFSRHAPPQEALCFLPSNCILFLFTQKQNRVPISLELVWKQNPDVNDPGEKTILGGGKLKKKKKKILYP